MPSLRSLAAVVAVAVSGAAAHGGVLSYYIAGKQYNGFKPYNSPSGQTTIQRPWSTYNPIQDATDKTLACNDDGTSLAGSAQQTATVAAGSKITAFWNQIWPHDTGPMLVYLANCGGSTCDGVNASQLKWFKIDQAGLMSGNVYTGVWASGVMIQQNSSWTTTIPTSVPSGHYLIRFETIALHSMPAQMYPECAQIEITGGGNRAPTAAELVSFPGAYSNNDPGLNIDLYSNSAKSQTTYQIPGPPLYNSGSGGAGGSPAPAPPASTVAPPASTVAPAPAPTASSPAGGTPVAKYGQCGGLGWTGSTTCVAGSTCTKQNDYYSQCT